MNLIIQVVYIHMITPLREVQVSPFPLYLPTLEINRFTTRIFLLGNQRHGIVTVDYHTPGIDTSQKEHLFFGIAGKCGNAE